MKKLILWLVLLVIGFLGGFIPQFLKVQRLGDDLAGAKQQLNACQAASLAVNQLAQLRDAATMMYFEASRKNYGNASDYANRFFTLAQQSASQTTDPSVKAALEDALKSRDAIIAELAKGDPAVIADLQPLVIKVQQGTQAAPR